MSLYCVDLRFACMLSNAVFTRLPVAYTDPMRERNHNGESRWTRSRPIFVVLTPKFETQAVV